MASAKPVKNTKAAAPAGEAKPAAAAGKTVKAKAAKPAATEAAAPAPAAPAAKKVPAKKVAAPKKVEVPATAEGEAESEEGGDEATTGSMGRSDLAAAIREKVHAEGLAVPEKVCVALVKGFEAVVADAVAAGRDINLPGFGKFTVKLRPARMGRNPQSGAETAIAASYAPAFKPGKALKDSANTRDASAA